MCLVVDVVSFIRTDEQEMLADTIREFLAASADLDRVRDASLTDDAYFSDVWQGLAEMGLIGLAIDEQYGGAGYGFEELAVVFEESFRLAPGESCVIFKADKIDGRFANDGDEVVSADGTRFQIGYSESELTLAPK